MTTGNSFPEENQIHEIRTRLIAWYLKNCRDLPWRKTKDPYCIWVSEIMLQQTQVSTVIPYYNRFLEQFPTIDALAMSDEETLMKAWEGLGYYSRVRNMKKTAIKVVETHGGVFPSDPLEIGKLMGIGPYTVGAIASIAFGIPLPAVDGNVVRVYSRLFCRSESWDTVEGKKIFQQLGSLMTDRTDPSSYNQGVMELGATLCTPTAPLCPQCPLNNHCQSYQAGNPEAYPTPKKKLVKKSFRLLTLCIQSPKGIFICKRPEDGPLQGLWSFPTLESADPLLDESVLAQWVETVGLTPLTVETGPPVKHIFTHQVWMLVPVMLRVADEPPLLESSLWADTEALSQLALPTAFQKVLKSIGR